MKKLLLLAIFGLAGYQLIEQQRSKPGPEFALPYVSVYGRDSCGYTQRMLADLRRSNIQYRYFIVDDQAVAGKLHERMRAAGLSTRHYSLPVVDVNGALSVRPAAGDVLREYRRP